MLRQRLCLGAMTVLTSACSLGQPTAPTIIPATLAPPVATARPGVWDSGTELAAWVTNGLSSGPAVVVGDGNDALIRIDLPACQNSCASIENNGISLHSPAFEPPVYDLRTVRIRYRWMPDGRYGGATYLSPNIDLQAPAPNLNAGLARSLFLIVVDHHGAWAEEEFTQYGNGGQLFSARGAVLTICGSCERGRLEIDWLALVRQ
jgi:hypothetical protein